MVLYYSQRTAKLYAFLNSKFNFRGSISYLGFVRIPTPGGMPAATAVRYPLHRVTSQPDSSAPSSPSSLTGPSSPTGPSSAGFPCEAGADPGRLGCWGTFVCEEVVFAHAESCAVLWSCGLVFSR